MEVFLMSEYKSVFHNVKKKLVRVLPDPPYKADRFRACVFAIPPWCLRFFNPER
jgi:hypothetical protein